jgi:hypothetical protein
MNVAVNLIHFCAYIGVLLGDLYPYTLIIQLCSLLPSSLFGLRIRFSKFVDTQKMFNNLRTYPHPMKWENNNYLLNA